jgi:hypothetical protein
LYKILTKNGTPPKPIDTTGFNVIYLDENNSINRDNVRNQQPPPEENDEFTSGSGGQQRVQCANQ